MSGRSNFGSESFLIRSLPNYNSLITLAHFRFHQSGRRNLKIFPVSLGAQRGRSEGVLQAVEQEPGFPSPSVCVEIRENFPAFVISGVTRNLHSFGRA